MNSQGKFGGSESGGNEKDWRTPDKDDFRFQYDNTQDDADDQYLNSPMDKESELTFIQYLKQSSQQSHIQALIDKYHTSQSSKPSFKKSLRSMKEEVLEIVESLPNQDEILGNIDQMYQEENAQETQIKIVKKEIRQMPLPIDLMDITERCEDLERLMKVISYQLSFNVMKHSDSFVQGMTNIQYLQEDLVLVKDISHRSKESIEHMKHKIALNALKSMMLKKKQQRLLIVKKITNDVVKKYIDKEKDIQKSISLSEYEKAAHDIQSGLHEIIILQAQFKLKCLEIIKDRYKILNLNLKDRISNTVAQLCTKFDSNLYLRVVNGQKVLMTENFSKSIAAYIKEKFKQQIPLTMKRSLIKYQVNNESSQNGMQVKIGTLGKMLDKEYYLQAICDLYKGLSNLLYSHHLITRHHSTRQQNIEDEQIRESLIQDRRDFWIFIQEKLINFFTMTKQFALDLSIRELYDLLMISNKFLEIGSEFGGEGSISEDKSSLLRYLANELSQEYVSSFNQTQIANVKNLLEGEEWDRLPIPDNFYLKELNEPIGDYPNNMDASLQLFVQYSTPEQAKNTNEKKNYFAQFAISNPFDKVNFISRQAQKMDTGATSSFSNFNGSANYEEVKGSYIQENEDKLQDSDEDDMDIGEEQIKPVQVIQGTSGSLEGASKSLRAYQQQTNISLNKDLVLSSSVLNTIKSTFSKYLELMSVCRHLSFDLCIAMTQTIELYCFLAFHMFAQSQPYKRLFDDSLTEDSLGKYEDLAKYNMHHEVYLYQQKYKNLRNFMIRVRNLVEAQAVGDNLSQSMRCSNPAIGVLIRTLPHAAIFNHLLAFEADQNILVYKTIIAVESLMYLQNALQSQKNLIKSLINSQQQTYIIQYMHNIGQMVEEMRKFLYEQHISEMQEGLDLQFFSNVQGLNWSIKSKKQEVSSYTDKILQSLKTYQKTRLHSVFKGSKVPKQVEKNLIEIFAGYVAEQMLNTISLIKKWNDLGRESMLQDVEHMRAKLQQETGTTIKDLEDLVLYTKSYFFSKEDLLDFVKRSADSKFTYQQIKSILAVAPSLSLLKSSEKKEFQMNVDIFMRDFFQNFVLNNSNSSHNF